MRALVFLLVLANLLFYAFSQGFFGQAQSPDAHRLTQQLAPEKVKILLPETPATKAVPTPPKPPPPAVTSEVVPPPVVLPAPAVEPVPTPKVIACSRWPALSPKDADRLAALIAKRFPDFKISRRPDGLEGGSWWVFIPPSPDKAAADQKASVLRAFGVSDYFVVQEPAPNRFAISLGIFSSEKGAQERLSELKEKGVRSAKLSARPGKDETVSLSASGPEGDRAALRISGAVWLPNAKVQDCK